MAEDGEKRDPKGHRTPSQLKRHGRTYQAKPEQKKKRAMRNKARAQAIKAGTVKKGDGKDVTHKKPLSKGGSNAKSNRGVQPASKNRAHGLTRGKKPNMNKGKKKK